MICYTFLLTTVHRTGHIACALFLRRPLSPGLIHKSSLLLLATLFYSCPGQAEKQRYASIIIDDLGNNLGYAQQIIDLPARITLSILPETTYAKTIAAAARQHHKEIMLHLPLQSIQNRKASPGTLKLHMTKQEFLRQLREDMASVPYIRGINNHMGSLLTRHPGYMRWLMEEMALHPKLFFVDSRTSSKTIAARIADEHSIANISRDVFLDPDSRISTIKHQFNRFIQLVRKHGYALAIAHPHPKTIRFLKTHLSELKQQGIKLVSVSRLILIRQYRKKHVTCTGTTCSGLRRTGSHHNY